MKSHYSLKAPDNPSMRPTRHSVMFSVESGTRLAVSIAKVKVIGELLFTSDMASKSPNF